MKDTPTDCTCSPPPSAWQPYFATPFPHSTSCPLSQIEGQESLIPDPRTTTEPPF